MSHVAGKKETQWISSSWGEVVATDKYGANGVVRIDLGKVNSEVSDISNEFNTPGMLANFAKRD